MIRRSKIERHLKILIYSISIILLVAGCVPETALPLSEDYITTKEKEWLEKAYRVDRNGWIFLHIEGEPFERGFQRGYLTANEIARLELGLKHYNLEKKTTGYISGSNVADNIKILRSETTAAYDDIRDRSVARRERWKQLMKEHYGKIDTEIAKRMLADHYDMYLGKENPSSRTICGHHELDDGSIPSSRGAYYPGGAVDGKVVDSNLAKNWRFWAKWGSSCDIGFSAKEFLEKHTQYDWLEGYLKDLPAEPWTIFPTKKDE